MKLFSVKLALIFLCGVLASLPETAAWGDDWVFYGGSHQEEVKGSTLRDWYALNRLNVVSQNEARAYHYYDRDSIGSNYPYAGGIVRVWEKAVLQGETRSFEEAREEIKREEEIRLKRKIGVLDYGWLFPYAVNRATKEIETLYEINCDTGEFYILEVDYYDKAERRMVRETNPEMNLWVAIRPETMMEALCKEVCKQEDGER